MLLEITNNGSESIIKSLNSAKKTLQEHIDKLPNLQYKSQVEGTIKNVKSQIRTLEKFIKNNNITPKK